MNLAEITIASCSEITEVSTRSQLSQHDCDFLDEIAPFSARDHISQSLSQGDHTEVAGSA